MRKRFKLNPRRTFSPTAFRTHPYNRSRPLSRGWYTSIVACFHPLTAYCDYDSTVIHFNSPLPYETTLLLPCGQCIGCRLERSHQWAIRCIHEASLYPDNSFITLTYDNDNLPSNRSLDKRHFQLFMKPLRKKYSHKKICFYHCGEYGDLHKRPHYHAILFNHHFEDRVPF
ncbi:rolling circle replication-associated protein [Candidatus Ruthia endofausta]|uniref:rolling circle replication-associated protein n=1 Tax=Candidatus Ruthia endofausta TaxID=2738852 RepID=UPI003BF56D4B